MNKQSFRELFKKYRLKSEFETLSHFGSAMAEQGRVYDDSTFAHWQNGNRVPRERAILLTIIKIFIQKNGITNLQEANLFLESAQQGFLTTSEIQSLPSLIPANTPFQVPNEIANFTGRQDLLQILLTDTPYGKKLLIHGTSGVGKTALAIHLGHLAKHLFPDGILWYKVDTANPMDILLSIAYTFQENISPIQDIETRASVVRSLLANKKILLILDNIEPDTNLRVLLPNSSTTVLLTSKYKSLPIDSPYESISLDSFTQTEVIQLFTKITSAEYTEKYTEQILELGQKVGNLHLALQIYAKQLNNTQQSPKSLIQQIQKAKIPFKDLSYEDKNLYTSIDLSFQSLDPETKQLFLSLSIFEGKDFSLPAVAAINKITIIAAQNFIQNLLNASLIDESSKQRYRIHPTIKNYIRTQPLDFTIYTLAMNYYAKLLQKNKRKNTLFYNTKNIYLEKENIIYMLEVCMQKKSYKEVLNIWKDLGLFFSQTGEWDKVLYYGEKIYQATKTDTKYQDYNYVRYTIDILARIYYFLGKLERTKQLITHGSRLAQALDNEYLIQFTQQRLGKLYQCYSKYDKSVKLLTDALPIIKKHQDLAELAYTYKFIGEVYIFQKQTTKAMENFEEAFKIVNQTKDITLLAIIYSTIGTMYYINKDYKKAQDYLLKGIQLEKAYGIKMGVKLFNSLTLALIAKKQEKITQAEKYYLQAKQENEYLHIRDHAEQMYAMIFLTKNDLQQAGYYIFD